MKEIVRDATVYGTPYVTVVEIMGRNAGWLTAAASLANDDQISPVDIICLPEVPFDMDSFIQKVAEVESKKQSTIIAVSEGICDKNGDYILAGMHSRAETDGFSHAALGGVGKNLEIQIAEKLGIKTRSIEFSTLQRCNSETASLCDVDESFAQGEEGARLAAEGKNRRMVGILREEGKEYKPYITDFDVSAIANKEKKIPKEMLSADGFGVTHKFTEYASPLISGQPKILYNNGVIDLEIR
jgi:6-phosphofructokinase 1